MKRKQAKFKGFEVVKDLTVNSGHVTMDDYNKLTRKDNGYFAVYHDEFHIRIHLGEEILREAEVAGMSENFRKLVEIALEGGCQWLTLDGDALVNPYFQTFDW